MSRFLRAATHAGKTGVGFNVQIVLHKLTSSDPDAKELEMVYPVVTRGSHKVKGTPAPILSSRQVHWTEETLSFHCTMYRTKQATFQAKSFTVDVVKSKGDAVLCTFEVDLAQYTSEKNHGSNSYSLVVQPKKAWGNGSLMMSLATALDTDRPVTASSTTASRTQHDQGDTSECERSSVAESPPKRLPSHIVSSRRMTFQSTCHEPGHDDELTSNSPVDESEASSATPNHHDDDVQAPPSSVSFAAQIIKYDRANKDLQAKLDAALLQLSQAAKPPSVSDEDVGYRAKYDALAVAHAAVQDELVSVKEKKAKAEKEVVLRRTELQAAMESSSRVNVVQLERIRHLTSVNEELKGKVQEYIRTAAESAPIVALRHVSSWSEGVGPQALAKPVDADLTYTPVAASNTVAAELLRLQQDKKALEEKATRMQCDVESLENQLFERSSELQQVLELHAHCNHSLSLKATELAKAHEEIVRLQMQRTSAATISVDHQDNTSGEADALVEMLQRTVAELQEEVSILQTKNSQLRDAKSKVETELCKRVAELKRSRSTSATSIFDQAQQEQLSAVSQAQAQRIRELEAQLAKTTEAVPPPSAEIEVVRNVLSSSSSATRPNDDDLLSKRQASTVFDAEVGYLKQQVRQLKDEHDRVQNELAEKTGELHRALDMHARMQRDSVQQLNQAEAQLEAEGHRLLVLQAQIDCLKQEKDQWMGEKYALEKSVAVESSEKQRHLEALAALKVVNEEVIVARIEEAHALHTAELTSLKSDMAATIDENQQLQAEVKALQSKSSCEHSDTSALRAQIQELKHDLQHMQYELSEKAAEMVDWQRQYSSQDQHESELQVLLDEKTQVCCGLQTQLDESQLEIQKLKHRIDQQVDATNDEMEQLLQQRNDEWMAAKDELAKCTWELNQLKAQQADEKAKGDGGGGEEEGSDVKQVEEEVKLAKDQLTSCELELESLKVVNRDLEAKVVALEKQLSASTSVDGGIDQLKKENEYFQTELVQTKMKLALLQEQHDDLSSEHKKIEKEWLLLKIQSAESALKAKKK
ncbi:hypothetical protein H257_07413 [Aphanomyces astaci]|uniref:C2 NT-type domain-containing protein n=1 Tax=Aphanomyces astaci TaxID=112090 RepID=W4GJ82_APHAT|nr:hypothetical protein H257_07413 [Aphanomyces astaci]ETV79391.1 hypothetical protein H257_07413 [Aphanomyces astaci]|eukprot:XP_009831232.1 hypothetical protein H257_07413 [Aphanomyces astaci]